MRRAEPPIMSAIAEHVHVRSEQAAIFLLKAGLNSSRSSRPCCPNGTCVAIAKPSTLCRSAVYAERANPDSPSMKIHGLNVRQRIRRLRGLACISAQEPSGTGMRRRSQRGIRVVCAWLDSSGRPWVARPCNRLKSKSPPPIALLSSTDPVPARPVRMHTHTASVRPRRASCGGMVARGRGRGWPCARNAKRDVRAARARKGLASGAPCGWELWAANRPHVCRLRTRLLAFSAAVSGRGKVRCPCSSVFLHEWSGGMECGITRELVRAAEPCSGRM